MATTKVYTVKIDGLDASGQKVGELRQELVELTEQLNTVGAGSEAATAILKRMGEVKGELKGLRDEVKALDPEKQITAFNNFAQGVVGAFGIATAAAETLGLSNTAADEYVKKTQAIIAVLSSLEAVRNALDGETLNAIKTTFANIKANFALGESYTLAGAKAKLASITTRQALLATGIGAVVVLVGLLISNFDVVSEYAGKIRQKFKPQFDAIGEFIDNTIARARDLASVLTFGLVDNAATAAKKAAQERANELIAIANESRARKIAVLEAEGKDTFALRARQIADELKVMKTGNAEEIKAFKDKYNELLVLEAQFRKKQAEDRKKAAEAVLAAEIASIQARIAVVGAGGRDTVALQIQLKQRELQALLSAETQNAAAIITKRGEIAALLVQQQQQAAQKEFEAFKKRVTETEKLATVTEGEAEKRKAEALTKLREELGKKIEEGTARQVDLLARQAEERAKQAANAVLPLGERLLIKLFGVSAEAVDRVKESLAESFATIQSSVQDIASAFLEASIADADTRLQEAQARVQSLNQQLSDQAKASENTAKQLDDAKGARRDFLIQKLAKERAEEEKTRAARAAAAKEEQAALKEKARLEQQAQRINAASIGIQTLLQAIEAGRAIAAAAKAGKFGIDNIAYTIAQTAALVSGFLAVKNAAKMEQGGLLRGPRHSAGGIPVGTTGIEVEGGEFVVNRWATAKFLPLLESINDAGRMRVLPAPSLRPKLEQGGQLPGALPGGIASAESVRSLEVRLDRNNALLEKILSATATTAATNQQIAAYGPPRLAIGPEQALAIEAQKQQGLQEKVVDEL